jgi:hypothetical protein
LSGVGNTSGKRDAEIVVAIVGVVPVHIRTRVIEVADIHEVAVRLATRFARHRPWLRQFANTSNKVRVLTDSGYRMRALSHHFNRLR